MVQTEKTQPTTPVAQARHALGPRRMAWLKYLRNGSRVWPDSSRAEFASVARYVENLGLTRYLGDGRYQITAEGHAAYRRGLAQDAPVDDATRSEASEGMPSHPLPKGPPHV